MYGKETTLSWHENQDMLEKEFISYHRAGRKFYTNRSKFFANLPLNIYEYEFSFSVYLSTSRVIMACIRNWQKYVQSCHLVVTITQIFCFFSMLSCHFIPNHIDGEWRRIYQMESYTLISFATSIAPNGIDVWLSGGISFQGGIEYMAEVPRFDVVKKINILRGQTFIMQDGPDLPQPLAGHCQVYIGHGKVFIYGGIKSIGNQIHGFNYSNQAYIWSQQGWSDVPTENPCSNNGQDLAFQQLCTTYGETKVVIVTFSKRKPCTALLDLITYMWNKVSVNDIPIYGHLVTSLDKTRAFYLGGIYHEEQQEVESFDVYELEYDGWRMTMAKLPFGIVSNETKSHPSVHNVTFN